MVPFAVQVCRPVHEVMLRFPMAVEVMQTNMSALFIQCAHLQDSVLASPLQASGQITGSHDEGGCKSRRRSARHKKPVGRGCWDPSGGGFGSACEWAGIVVFYRALAPSAAKQAGHPSGP